MKHLADNLQRSENAQFPVHRFFNSGFMLAKLFTWMMENEDEIQNVLLLGEIPPHVFSV